MPNMVQNVVAGKPLATGGVLTGPIGSVLPTDVTTAPAVGIVAVGYISDDGVSETMNRDTDKIKAWGGDVVKIVQTEHSVTYEYTMIEYLSELVNREVYGEANVVATPATASTGNQLAVKVTADQLPHAVRILEIKDGDARVRIVLPDSQITEVGDITYQDGALIAYPVTVEAFPDANGVKAYKYSDDGKTAA